MEELKQEEKKVIDNNPIQEEEKVEDVKTSKPKKYDDDDVDNIVKSKKKKWGKQMENEIKLAVEEATKPLQDQLSTITKELESERNAKTELQNKQIKQNKINVLKNALESENVLNADLLIPHINIDALEINDNGDVVLGDTIATLKGKFPSVFGTVKPGTGGKPSMGGRVEQLTDTQRANQFIQQGNNKAAIGAFLKAGKI